MSSLNIKFNDAQFNIEPQGMSRHQLAGILGLEKDQVLEWIPKNGLDWITCAVLGPADFYDGMEFRIQPLPQDLEGLLEEPEPPLPFDELQPTLFMAKPELVEASRLAQPLYSAFEHHKTPRAMPGDWKVVYADGKLETMSDAEFRARFVKVAMAPPKA